MGYRIRIDDRIHSRIIQMVLAEQGYFFHNSKLVQYTEKPFLYFGNDGTSKYLTYGVNKSGFDKDARLEVRFLKESQIDFLKTIKSGTFGFSIRKIQRFMKQGFYPVTESMELNRLRKNKICT